MKNLYHVLIILPLLFLFTESKAHSDEQWCSGVIQDSGQIMVDEQQLEANLSTAVICGLPVVDESVFPRGSILRSIVQLISPLIFRTHDQFDEDNMTFLAEINDYDYASVLAYSYCACATLSGQSIVNPSQVNPSFSTPALKSLDHHSNYGFDQGLNLTCQVCKPHGSVLNGH